MHAQVMFGDASSTKRDLSPNRKGAGPLTMRDLQEGAGQRSEEGDAEGGRPRPDILSPFKLEAGPQRAESATQKMFSVRVTVAAPHAAPGFMSMCGVACTFRHHKLWAPPAQHVPVQHAGGMLEMALCLSLTRSMQQPLRKHLPAKCSLIATCLRPPWVLQSLAEQVLVRRCRPKL